ncbi:hypothetical protein YC2023_118747 [Brassica napus]
MRSPTATTSSLAESVASKLRNSDGSGLASTLTPRFQSVAIRCLLHCNGLVRNGTAFVTFPLKYQCVVFRPFKGQILEAVVTLVNKAIWDSSRKLGCSDICLIPDDTEFQAGDMPNYTTSDGSVKIQKECEVRLKIIGTRVDATEIFCVGTIKDDFLGVINDPAAA